MPYAAFLVFGAIALSAVAGGAWNVPAQAVVSAVAALSLGFAAYRRSFVPSNIIAAFAAFFIFAAYLWLRVFLGAQSILWRGFIEAANWPAYMAVYAAAASFTDEERKIFFAATLRLGAFLAALFFAQKIFGAGASDAATWATFPKKNIFAAVMLASALSVFDFAKTRISAVEWMCYMAAMAASAFAFSVSIALGFLASAVVLFARVFPSKKRLWIPVITFLSGAVVMGKFLEPRVWDRAAWYAASIKMFAVSPVFGHGPGSFAELSAGFTAAGFKSIYAHSLYLEMLSETGLMGLALLAILLYFILRNITDTRSRAIFTLIATASATDFLFSVPVVPLMFFAAAGAGSVSFRTREDGAAATGINKLPRVASLITAIFILAVSYVKYDVWARAYRAETAIFSGDVEAASVASGSIGYGRLGASAAASIKTGTIK
ncbi:MAG: hypothetical protein CVU77_00650 [Elusimicrobia bacterium HGW-Elusimicrobia-1]|nr:MAG: hypothetical protein CVU77_00650 [Elusimicrobia bacterium HGW-Elusimicrobia-1]